MNFPTSPHHFSFAPNLNLANFNFYYVLSQKSIESIEDATKLIDFLKDIY